MEHHGFSDGGKMAGSAPVTTSQWHDGGKMAEVIIKTDKVSDVGRLLAHGENPVFRIDKKYVLLNS